MEVTDSSLGARAGKDFFNFMFHPNKSQIARETVSVVSLCCMAAALVSFQDHSAAPRVSCEDRLIHGRLSIPEGGHG